MTLLRLAGWAVLAVAVSGWLAVVEVLWLPLRVGGVFLPLSVAAAVVGNLLLIDGAHRLSGSRLIGLLPAVVWLLVAIGGSVQTAEGDLLITGQSTAASTVGLAFLLLGVVAASFAVGRVIAGPRRPRPVTVVDQTTAAADSGSGGAR